MLTYTTQGWEIEKDTFSDELVKTIKGLASRNEGPEDFAFLKDRTRSLIWAVLDKIADSQDPSYIPALEQWKQIEYRKVRERIGKVIQRLRDTGAAGK